VAVVADLLTPAAVAAMTGAAVSYRVGQATARSTVESAQISADVEFERLAHERKAWRAMRWAQASGKVVALGEQMEIVANPDVDDEFRGKAASRSRTLLVEVMLLLQEDPAANHEAKTLLSALHDQDLSLAARIWGRVHGQILSGALS
jgi:hypothetical protein